MSETKSTDAAAATATTTEPVGALASSEQREEGAAAAAELASHALAERETETETETEAETAMDTAAEQPDAVLPTRGEVGKGLAFLHGVVGAGVLSHTETSAHLYALTELLLSKGVISLRELEQRKATNTQAAMQQTLENWPGAKVLPDESDKYDAEPVDIDCLSRLHLCKAACCRLVFNLSRQDLAEGVVEWEFGNPYQIKHREDGYCTHCRPGTLSCAVREQRPLVCRTYDCRRDTRIWEDFEARQPNPALRDL